MQLQSECLSCSWHGTLAEILKTCAGVMENPLQQHLQTMEGPVHVEGDDLVEGDETDNDELVEELASFTFPEEAQVVACPCG